MEFLTTINNFLWGVPALIILVGAGVYLTFKLRFIQFRHFKHAILLVCGKYNDPKHKGEISHFQALATGLSGAIGTGNIAGVATAILLGGPGAIFWMWVSAIFGMATKFSACTLALKFRQIKPDGEISGGPMYTLLHGLNMPKLAAAFALFTLIASFGIANTVQANSIVDGLNYIVPQSHAYDPILGLIIAIGVALVILGGIKRIAKVASIIVPIMAILYIGAAIIILAIHVTTIPHAFYEIFNDALNPSAAGGGMLGAAIRYGTARGVFSNEAGLGSTAMAHAAAKTDEPVREGLVAMLEPFFDTIVICTFTALVILVTGVWKPEFGSAAFSTALSAKAFSAGLYNGIGGWIVGIGLIFFAYSSMIAWAYYGDRACEFLFGTKSIIYYRIIFVIVIFFGAIAPLRLVWQLADLANIFMAVPNIIGIILLAPLLRKLQKIYFQQDI